MNEYKTIDNYINDQGIESKEAPNTLKEPIKQISCGVVHPLPSDLKTVLSSDRMVLELWEKITPLARNEWICWIEDAKKFETRSKRIARLCNDLPQGKKRPCCWAGCPHRNTIQN